MAIYFIDDDFGLSTQIEGSEIITESQFIQNINNFNSSLIIFKDPKFLKYKDVIKKINSSFFYINSIYIQPYDSEDSKKYFYKINYNSYFDSDIIIDDEHIKLISKRYYDKFNHDISNQKIDINYEQIDAVVPTDDKIFKMERISKDDWIKDLSNFNIIEQRDFEANYKSYKKIITNDIYFAFRNYISGVNSIIYVLNEKTFYEFSSYFKNRNVLESCLSSIFTIEDFNDGVVKKYILEKIKNLDYNKKNKIKISKKIIENITPNKKNVEILNLEFIKNESKSKIIKDDTISCFYDSSKSINRISISSIYNSYKETKILSLKEELPDNGLIYINGPKVVNKYFEKIVKENRKFIFLDNFYLYDDSKYKIIYNHIHPMKNNFYDFNHNIKIDEWKDNYHGYILLCPPTGELIKPYGIKDNWLEETISIIRNKTDRVIKIRFKSPELIEKNSKLIKRLLKNYLNLEITKEIIDCDLNELIDNSYAVVAPASGVCVKAAIRGIPVFSESFGPTADISLSDYSKINEPIFPDRELWLNKIMAHEFSVKDISNGTWLLRLKKIYPELDFIDEKNINTF